LITYDDEDNVEYVNDGVTEVDGGGDNVEDDVVIDVVFWTKEKLDAVVDWVLVGCAK
jgi:uncharacterized protein YycO